MGTAAAEGGPTSSGSPTVRGIRNPVMTDIGDQNSHSKVSSIFVKLKILLILRKGNLYILENGRQLNILANGR
jgi:hypothetical protein